MKYAEIFHLRIRHDYFADGACHDLRITPDPETERRIAGHRLRLRTLGDRVILLGECTEQGNLLLAPGTDLEFRFLLQPRNSSFFSYSALDQPQNGRIQFTSAGATESTSGQYRLATSIEEKPVDRAWATATIVVDSTFSLPPQSPNVYDIAFTAAHQPWNLFLTTAQADEGFHIRSGQTGLHFQKVALSDLLASSTTDYALSQLDQASAWTGSNESGLGLDFTVAPNAIGSQGPAVAGNTQIWLSTEVLPVVGRRVACHLDLGFTPNASNQARLILMADQADLGAASLNGYCVQVGETGSTNKLRFLRIVEGVATELAESASAWSGNLSLDLDIRWGAGGAWEVWAAPQGQPLAREIAVADAEVVPGTYFGLLGSYTVASRATAFHLNNLAITLPYGDPDLLGRHRAVAEMLATQFPQKNQYLFASAGPVKMQEKARKGLALYNGTTRLIEHLSNPAPGDNGTLFFHI